MLKLVEANVRSPESSSQKKSSDMDLVTPSWDFAFGQESKLISLTRRLRLRKNVEEAVEKALSSFRGDFNYAESTLLSIANNVIEIRTDLIPRIATGFGGGISRQGYVCGAVSGAVIGFGLKYGRSSPDELRASTYNRVVEFYKQFQERFGSIICKELSGCDLSAIEGVRKFRAESIHERKCTHFVAGAVEIFTSLVDEKQT